VDCPKTHGQRSAIPNGDPHGLRQIREVGMYHDRAVEVFSRRDGSCFSVEIDYWEIRLNRRATPLSALHINVQDLTALQRLPRRMTPGDNDPPREKEGGGARGCSARKRARVYPHRSPGISASCISAVGGANESRFKT